MNPRIQPRAGRITAWKPLYHPRAGDFIKTSKALDVFRRLKPSQAPWAKRFVASLAVQDSRTRRFLEFSRITDMLAKMERLAERARYARGAALVEKWNDVLVEREDPDDALSLAETRGLMGVT